MASENRQAMASNGPPFNTVTNMLHRVCSPFQFKQAVPDSSAVVGNSAVIMDSALDWMDPNVVRAMADFLREMMQPQTYVGMGAFMILAFLKQVLFLNLTGTVGSVLKPKPKK